MTFGCCEHVLLMVKQGKALGKIYGISTTAACDIINRKNWGARSMNDPVTDESLMPFGKYRGTPMGEIRAQYLLWLWDNGIWQEKGKPVHNYIADNFSALEMDAPDYIVGHRP